MKIEFCRRIFEKKSSDTYFMKILLLVAELFHADGRADRRDETGSRFTQFCERD